MAARWVEDSGVAACPKCKDSFGIFTRKHHCRQCGGVFCNPCAPTRGDASIRYCAPCWDVRRSPTPPAIEWLAVKREAFERFQREIAATDFEHKKTIDGVRFHQVTRAGRKTSTIKLEGHAPHPPVDIIKTAMDPEHIPKVDPERIIHCEVIEEVDATTKLFYQVSAMPGPVSDRAFLNLVGHGTLDDGTIYVVIQSVMHHARPLEHCASKKYERAWAFGGYYLRESEDKRGTDIVVVGEFDLRGDLPADVVNWFADEGATLIPKATKYLDELKQRQAATPAADGK